MGFFDFVADMPHYAEHDKPVPRLNRRHSFLIEPFADEIEGAKVLDLASHDGRWCYAFAGAGAASVVGIEARQELVEKLADYPDATLRDRIEMRVGDLYKGIDAEVEKGETYDVIGVFGILYHLMDHFRLFQALRDLKPKLVIVDSEFMLRPAALIWLIKERTDNILNAAPQYDGQKVAVKGIPSFAAMNLMAESLNYDIEWLDWDVLPKEDRLGVADYYRPEKMRRATCALRLRDR